MTVKHPAKFSNNILDVFKPILDPSWLILDPFAGTGRIHELGFNTVGVELEYEWAALHPRTINGNALCLPFRDNTFDAACTSPVYANRLSDHHEAKDGSVRHSYRHDLGRKLHSDNSGQLQWGELYRRFSRAVWIEVSRVLKPEAKFVLNTSNHIRKGTVIDVVGWHESCLEDLGFVMIQRIAVATPRLRYGVNAAARVEAETVSVWFNKNKESCE